MRILLDTHVFIWWNDDPSRLSKSAFAACQNTANTIILSLVSIWEMQIKIQLGKLKFSMPLEQAIQHQQSVNGLMLLDIQLPHILLLGSLPDHHRDPFDRLLIAQATHEHIPIVSHDPLVAKYGVSIIW